MRITARHRYHANPEEVYAMLNDKDFLKKVAARADATEATVSTDADGIELRASVVAPQKAQKLVGEELTLALRSNWTKLMNNRAEAVLSASVDRLPATLSGTAKLSGNESETIVEYDCEFSVRVALVGKRIEQAAAPYVTAVIDKQQEVGNEWLG